MMIMNIIMFHFKAVREETIHLPAQELIEKPLDPNRQIRYRTCQIRYQLIVAQHAMLDT